MFGVCYGITNDLKKREKNKQKRKKKRAKNISHIFEESLENATGLFVNEAGDTLDTATTSETTNGGLGDTLDVVTKNLALKEVVSDGQRKKHRVRRYIRDAWLHPFRVLFHLFHVQT
jgi:hypothetical protein